MARPQPTASSFRALFLPIYLPSLILSFCDGLLVPVLPLFANSLTPSFALVGVALAADAIGTLMADLPAGVMLRRLDRRGAMVLGVGLVALATGLLATGLVDLMPGIWLLVALRLAAGIGAALWNISRHAHIAQVTSGTDRGRAVALYGGIRRAGSFAGPAVGGWIAAAAGNDAVFLLYALLALPVLPLAWIFVDPQKEGGIAAARPRLRPLLQDQGRLLVVAGSGQLLAQAIRAGRKILIPLFGASVLGLDVASIGLILSISAFVDAIMFYPAGLLMDRKGRKWAIVPSFVLQALGMALVPFSGGFVGLLIATALMGFGNGLGSGTMMTLGADLAPRNALGEFLGVWRLIGDTGMTVGPLLVGGLASLAGLPGAAVATALVGFAAASTFAWGVPETLRRDRA